MRFLEGVRVLEFCEVAAGPFCSLLLADLGADVVKIEKPEGDTLRQWPPLSDGFSENFASLNRNKRSVVLDLRDPKGAETARRLALEADVVVENYGPGVLGKLGLGYDALSAGNPKLVYCSISAFGQTGPRANEGGFDLTLQAISGIMSVTGEGGGRPIKCGVPLSDFSAGLYGAYAIAAALLGVQRDGKGTHIDVALLGASLGIAALQTSEYFGRGRDPLPLGSAHPRNAPYQAFQAADGYFAMAAGNDRLWQSVCDVLGLDELAEDPRFRSTSLRARHQDELRRILEERFLQQPARHWVLLFSRAGVPAAPINRYSEALDDPQVQHMGWVQKLTLPGGAQTRTVGFPLRFSGEAPVIRRPPPALGADTAAVLEELEGP